MRSFTCLEDIRNLPDSHFYLRVEGWREGEFNFDPIEYNRIDKENLKDIFFEFPYCAYGDYVGDIVTKSNYTELDSIVRERWPNNISDESEIVDIESGYDYHTYYIQVPFFLQCEELQDIAAHLCDYPVIDDMAVSELEDNTVGEYLKSEERSLKNDILEKYLDMDIYSESCDNMDMISDIIDWAKWYRKLMEITNTEAVIETGCTVYIDSKNIQEYFKDLKDEYVKYFSFDFKSMKYLSTCYIIRLVRHIITQLEKGINLTAAELAFITKLWEDLQSNSFIVQPELIPINGNKKDWLKVLKELIIPALNYHNIQNTGIQGCLKIA